MLLKRKDALSLASIGLGHSLLNSQPPSSTTQIKQGPKRIIFFLQNQGFEPLTAIPEHVKKSCSLEQVKFQEPIKDLEPYKDMMHIITGLHGRHTSPFHSAYFGALGGYRGGIGVPPAAETIDHAISKLLPQTVLPHLCIGMDSFENMSLKPTLATLSASAAGQPIFMHSNPNLLYQMIFGCISTGDVKKNYLTKTDILKNIERLATIKGEGLTQGEFNRYSNFTGGLSAMNRLQDKLIKVSNQLKKFVPKFDQRYTKPKFDTDWHDVLLEIGLASLQANITNVLTIGSGRGEIFGSWKGLGITDQGHSLGHMKQVDNPIWIKIRQYNCKMLVKTIKALQAVSEGNGTMMDNSLIIYTSNNADKQHTGGENWPFICIGNLSGRINTNRYSHIQGRTINALYTTLLHALDKPVEHFNMTQKQASILDKGKGPIDEILA